MMRTTLSIAVLLGVPTMALAQNAPAPPSVAEAQANVARAQQILAAALAYDAAEKKRIAAEAEAATARELLATLNQDGSSVAGSAPSSKEAGPDAAAVAAADKGVVTTTTSTKDGKTVVEVKPYSPAGLPDNQTGRQKFGGIEFGIGVALSVDLGNNDRIREAEIVDNIVRVTRTDNIRARLILESHYLFTPSGTLPLLGLHNQRGDVKCLAAAKSRGERALCDRGEKNWGFGPFVSLQPGTDNVIDAVGGGLMLGFKRPGETNDAFNIGVGVLYDVDAQILGRGFVEDRAPPGNETEVRFRRQSQSGLLVMTSYTF